MFETRRSWVSGLGSSVALAIGACGGAEPSAEELVLDGAEQALEVGPLTLAENTRFGDFNGDGLEDIFFLRSSSDFGPRDALVSLAAAGSDHVTFAPVQRWQSGVAGGGLVIGDFDGDGCDEYVQRSPGALGRSDCRGAFTSTALTVPCASVTDVQVGDFNGDGRSDLACIERSATATLTISVARSTSRGFGFEPTVVALTLPSSSQASVLFADMNGDGADDAIVAQPYVGRGTGAIRTFLADDEAFGTAVTSGWIHYSDELVRVGQFNGDDVPDIVAYSPASESGQMVARYGNTSRDGSFGDDEVVAETFNSFGLFAFAELNADFLDDVLGVREQRTYTNEDILKLNLVWGTYCRGNPRSLLPPPYSWTDPPKLYFRDEGIVEGRAQQGEGGFAALPAQSVGAIRSGVASKDEACSAFYARVWRGGL
jgi:hypothetical protein